MRKKFLIVPAIGLIVAGAGVSLASALGLQVPVKGSATLCLSPAASAALDQNDVTLAAIAPATLDTTGSTPCVKVPAFTGKIAPDLSEGLVEVQGGMSFARANTQERLGITALTGDMTTRSISGELSHGTAATANTRILNFSVDPSYVTITTDGVGAAQDPATLTAQGATAFEQSFGFSPVPAGDVLFRLGADAQFTAATPGL